MRDCLCKLEYSSTPSSQVLSLARSFIIDDYVSAPDDHVPSEDSGASVALRLIRTTVYDGFEDMDMMLFMEWS